MNATLAQPSLTTIRQPVMADLRATDLYIEKALHSNISLIQNIIHYILRSGGKRIRPLLVLLIARALGYSTGSEHHELATVIEFIHTATLLHDDVVDKSELRRGNQTANHLWGNSASVLVGDFLYSRAFQILAIRNNIPVMHVLADATNQLAEGEVLQLLNVHDTEVTEARYLEVIQRKTATLFESACHIAALLATDNQTIIKAAACFGHHVGMAYQIMDDILDYQAEEKTLGKTIGEDLIDGKATLPLIYALQQANPTEASLIQQVISGKADAHTQLETITHIIQKYQADIRAKQVAEQHIQQAQAALTAFPTNIYQQALLQLADFTLQRNA